MKKGPKAFFVSAAGPFFILKLDLIPIIYWCG